MNRWIDVMYIASFPDYLDNVLNWFQGYIIFRAFGHGDINTYTNVMKLYSVSINKIAAHSKYIWSPVMLGLDEPEDRRITKNRFYLNAFASQERVGRTWKYERSKPIISTTISYLDLNHPAKGVYLDFAAQFADIPHIVLGKNGREAKQIISKNIAGYMNKDMYYSKIAASRLFVYLGFSSYYHLHMVAIEALRIGVPVLFLEKSGLVKEARDHRIPDMKLKQAGMCGSVSEMRQIVQQYMNNPDYLNQLSRRQGRLFGQLFSRDAALQRSAAFINGLQGYVRQYRTVPYSDTVYCNRTLDLR